MRSSDEEKDQQVTNVTEFRDFHRAEAGQQLAEARERAARAETEAEFLRERLGELRKPPTAPPAVDEHDRAAEPANPSEAKRPGRDADGKSLPTEPVWEYAVRRWRLRRGR